MKRNNAWKIRCSVDESFVPLTQRASLLYWRLSDLQSKTLQRPMFCFNLGLTWGPLTPQFRRPCDGVIWRSYAMRQHDMTLFLRLCRPYLVCTCCRVGGQPSVKWYGFSYLQSDRNSFGSINCWIQNHLIWVVSLWRLSFQLRSM